MSTYSVPLDDLDQQSSPSSSAVSAPLDDLDQQSASAPAPPPLARPSLPTPSYAPKPAAQFPSFAEAAFNQPPSPADEAAATRAATRVNGVTPSEPAGRPHDPQLDVPYEADARTGEFRQRPLVPEADRIPVFDAWTGVEPVATGLSRFKENDQPAYNVDPNNPMGPPVRTMSPQEQERQRRQRMLGAAETLQGAGQLMEPAAAASAMLNPLPVIAGYGAGVGASEGIGSAVHSHVSPEDEELIRTASFFLPSLLGTASGLKTGSVETPEGKFSGASVFGGKVRAGVATTPDVLSGRIKVGGTQFEVNIPRNGQPAPESSEAAKLLTEFEQHTGNPDFQPTPQPPAPPPNLGPQHLTPEIAKGISDTIMKADPAQRPALMTEAHANMAKWMMGRGTFVGPDHKIYTVDNEKQASKLAGQFINDEVDRVDKAQAAQTKAAKATTEQPAATQQPTTVAPISGAPPAGKGLTSDTAAGKKVAAEADIHPAQQPAIIAKEEPPKDTVALAKPPGPVKQEDVAAIGKEEPESGRTVLQPSDDVMQNERLASEAAPELTTRLSHISAGVEGATFDRVRPQKELERIDEKVDLADKPPQTVPDYLAAQIAADTPQAKDQLISELKKQFKVIGVEDAFLNGREKLAGYPSANVQVQMSNGLTAEVQIVPREVQETINDSHKFYTAGREAELRGDHTEKEKQFAEAKKIHDAAMDKFRQRNGIEEVPEGFEKGSTQINIDPQSDLAKAHSAAVAAIPDEHLMPTDFGGTAKGREDKPHVTVRYGLKDDSPEAVQKIRNAAAEIQPFEVPIGKTDTFPPSEHSDGAVPVIARLEVTPELKALREAMEKAGNFHEDTFPEYKPHVTLAYVKPEFAEQYKGGNHLEGQKVPVKEIVVSKKDGTQETIPLGGQQAGVSAPLDELDKVERRTNLAERKRVEHMTPEERAHELLTSQLTGLPNYRAFHEDEGLHPHVGYADVDDFKPFNTILGKKNVDRLVLPKIGEAFRQAMAKEPGGSIKVYHRSGDEFLFRTKDKAAVTRVVERVNKELAEAVFTAEAPDGTIREKKGVGLSHGTGNEESAAEHNAEHGTHLGSKQQRKAAGLRSGSRDLPERVGEEAAKGQQVGGREATKPQFKITKADIVPTEGGSYEAIPHSAPLDELDQAAPDIKKDTLAVRVPALIDRFTDALSAGTLPSDPREIRAMAKEEVGGDPAKYIDDIYDAIEGATNRYMRDRRPEGLAERIKYAAGIEEKIGKRTRTLEITKLQQFSTPHPISEAAAYATGVMPDDTVLEPTAGTGNLVEPIRTDAEIMVNELDPRRADVLKANGYQHITQQDYLKSQFKPDVIVTNPPWGKISSGRYKALDVPAPWGRFNDVSERFMVKNLRDLPQGGRLVAIVPTTILQPGSGGFRKWIDQTHTLRAMIQSPPEAYVHRGTTVDSVLMVVDKGKIAGAEEPILRLESNQPKDWAEYAAAVKPLADGGSHARVTGTTRATGETAERAPLGDRTPARSQGAAAGADGGRGLPELREPGASPESVRSERAGVGANVVPAGDVSESVDSPGADGASQPATAPRLVRQGTHALRPENVSRERAREFDEANHSPVFTPYVLRSGVSGNPHPRQIVETRSLAGAPAPEINYQPSKGVIDAHKRKVISDEQVDTVAAVGQANERGHALMVADDVGLGKSREIAASAIDWLEKGKAKRILITSKGEVNLRDLESEMKVVAGTDNLPFKYIYLRDYKEAAERAQNTKPYNPVPKTDNTVYVVESFNLTPYRRAIQDLGIDGVLGDEVHTYKNDDAGVGQTWKVLHADWLQRKVPIAYFTATPGTTLDDLEYLYGLKEWPLDGFSDWVARKTGHGTEETQKKRGTVPGQTQDLAQQVGSDSADVSKTGRVTRVAQSLAAAKLTGDRAMIAHWERELKQAEKDQKNKKWGQSKGDSFHVTVSTAEMEQIMRELKMKGKYGARDLWRSGVEFAEKEAPLTQAESDSYRQSVNYMREVEKAFNAFANENEAMRRGFGITAFLQSAAKRRLFDVRLTRAMKEAKESLARGEQPVISVINVNETKVGEGYMAAALNQINVNKVLVDKETGEVTDLGEIPEAVAVKNDLIERAEQEFPPSPDPIAMIQKEFGKDKVSVITGNESPKVRRQMMEDFQQGIRKIAVISGAGKTGISLHHVTETPGGAKGRRHLILADYEWSATNFKQELGRVDRSGQASAPKITALTLGSAAEKKFISTIANRMKTLGAVSKGAAESTGTGALEHFELGGDIDNQVVRDMWRTLPLGLREQFRGKQFMNYDKDGVARPKSAIEGVGVRDFLLQLQLIPVEEGNQIWDHFWKQREETYSGDAVATREAQKTGKTKGEILRVHQLGPDLDLYEIKDSSGHRAGILSGMVTEHMNALQSHLESGEEKTAEGMTVIRKRREYTSFTGSNGEQISGLRLRPGQIEPIAKAFGKGIAYEHTPETALQDVVAGDKVPLDNGWTLYMGKGGERKGYVVIDGAKLSNTNRGQDVLRHGAKYNAVSGGFFYLPEDKEAVKQFLDRFPIKKQVATAPYIKNPTRIVPGSKSAYSDNETGLGEMQQLTDSIAKSSPGASLSSRIRIGSNLGEKAAGAKDEVTSLLGRLKGGFAALADAVKRPPKAGDYEKATGEWSGADQRSALDLYRFTKAIKAAVPEKLTREAISNWIEASGDEDLLRERAGKSDKEFKPGYEAALKLTDAEKTIAQNIMNLHDATLQESIKAGILEAGVENYIQHVYADKPKFAARIRAEMNFNTLVTKPSFSKKRSLPTYFDAEQLGFTPKDKDVGFLTSVHERSLREALAARAYIESLMGGEASDGRPLVATSWASAKEIGEEQPAYVIKPNIKAGEEFADYKSIDHPALRGWKWAGNVDGKNVFVQGDALVHPEIHQKLKNNLSTSALRRYQITIGDKTVRPGAFALDTAAEIKSFVLSFSVFHQTTLGIHALEHKVWPRHMPKLDLNDPVQSGLVDHGLMVAHYDAMEAFGEGLSSGGLVTKTPGIGPLYRTYVDYLFRDYMPRLKMQMAKVALERNRKRYPELSEDQLQFLTASQANAAFGGLNYRLLGRNKTLQDTLRLFLMAPDFTEARARFVAQAGTKYGREQLVALMLGAAVLYTAARIINEMSDKDPHWDKPFSVVHDGKEYHLRTVQGDVMDAATDPKTFLQNRVSPPVSAVFKNEDPHFHKKHESLADKLKSHGEGAVPIPLQPWMRQSKDSNAEKAMDSLLKMIGINEKKEQKKH